MVGFTHIFCRIPYIKPDKLEELPKKGEPEKKYTLQKRIPSQEELDEFIKLTESILEENPSEPIKSKVNLKA